MGKRGGGVGCLSYKKVIGELSNDVSHQGCTQNLENRLPDRKVLTIMRPPEYTLPLSMTFSYIKKIFIGGSCKTLRSKMINLSISISSKIATWGENSGGRTFII